MGDPMRVRSSLYNNTVLHMLGTMACLETKRELLWCVDGRTAGRYGMLNEQNDASACERWKKAVERRLWETGRCKAESLRARRWKRERERRDSSVPGRRWVYHKAFHRARRPRIRVRCSTQRARR